MGISKYKVDGNKKVKLKSIISTFIGISDRSID